MIFADYNCISIFLDQGLDDLVISRKDDFLGDVDYVCISDNYWQGTTKPCLTYGLRGLSYFNIEVECAAKDLHSGVYGGSVHEAMSDVIKLMSKLVDNRGRILIPGVMDDVKPMDNAEEKLYHCIEFDCEEFRSEVGTNRLLHTDKVNTLTHRWRFPSLSLHGIEGAFSGAGSKTVIPRKVIGKFSIRLVPDQQPERIEKQVVDYLQQQFELLGSPNTFKAYMVSGGRPWVADTNHPNFEAGKLAIKRGK